MINRYTPPLILREWKNDISGGDLYVFMILDNETVCSGGGRYAHSSGSSSCEWDEFLNGSLHELVRKTMGEEVLMQALADVKVRTSSNLQLQQTPSAPLS
jgi:hypothetical protein